MNLGKRFQYALQGYSQTQFFYGQLQGLFYDPSLAPLVSRDLAQATRTTRGGTAFGIYPLSRFRRVEFSGGLVNLREQYNDPLLQQFAQDYQQQTFGQQVFRSGTIVPLSAAFIQETTVFREFGPLAGSTMRLAYDVAPKIGNTLSRQTFDGDLPLLPAAGHERRAGVAPARVQEHRGLSRLHVLRWQLRNARLRLPELRRPDGGVRQRRTPLPDHRGGAHTDRRHRRHPWCVLREHRRRLVQNQDFTFATSNDETMTPITGYQTDAAGNIIGDVNGNPIPIIGSPRTVSGFRLKDGRASYGLGLETFALGFPIHFDWSWRTTFNKDWEDQLFAVQRRQLGIPQAALRGLDRLQLLGRALGDNDGESNAEKAR